MSALDIQVGGSHYKDKAIQPVEFCHANNLGGIESSIVRYAFRWTEKNGVEDLKKIPHYLALLRELEPVATSTEKIDEDGLDAARMRGQFPAVPQVITWERFVAENKIPIIEARIIASISTWREFPVSNLAMAERAAEQLIREASYAIR